MESINKKIETIIKNKYNLLSVNISDYDNNKLNETLLKYMKNKNNNFIMYSNNKAHILQFIIAANLQIADYILFYKDDFITFLKEKLKITLEGHVLKKILNIEQDLNYDQCFICLETVKLGGVRCNNCGYIICINCKNDLITNNKYNKCQMCNSKY